MWIQYTPPAAKSTYTQHSCCFQVHVAHYVTQFRFENLSIEPASQYHVGTTCQNGRTEQGCRLIFNRLQNQLGRCVLHLTIHINPSEKVSTYIPYPPAKKKWEWFSGLCQCTTEIHHCASCSRPVRRWSISQVLPQVQFLPPSAGHGSDVSRESTFCHGKICQKLKIVCWDLWHGCGSLVAFKQWPADLCREDSARFLLPFHKEISTHGAPEPVFSVDGNWKRICFITFYHGGSIWGLVRWSLRRRQLQTAASGRRAVERSVFPIPELPGLSTK